MFYLIINIENLQDTQTGVDVQSLLQHIFGQLVILIFTSPRRVAKVPMALMVIMLAAAAAPTVSQAFVEEIVIAAGPGSLMKARDAIRSKRNRGTQGKFRVRLGAGVHRVPMGGFRLQHPQDAAVEWVGSGNSTFIEGGIRISGWTPYASSAKNRMWFAPAPDYLLEPGPPAVRTMWVNGERFNRTQDSAETFDFGGLLPGTITTDGYQTPSALPLQWSDPTSVEIVADFTWVQHRCRVTSVRDLRPDRGWEQDSLDLGRSCDFYGQKYPGSSPGSSIKLLPNISTWKTCQQHCCDLVDTPTPCKAIIYHPKQQECYLLDRTFEKNFRPNAGDSFVANMNGPPPPVARTEINISSPCWNIARRAGYGQITFPSFFENTGNFSNGHASGEWWLDRAQKRFVVRMPDSGSPAPPRNVYVSTEEILLDIAADDVSWRNVTFRYSTWKQSGRPEGFVERYGNTFFVDATKRSLKSPPASIMVAGAARVDFSSCSWTHIGGWGLRFYNGTQNSSVRYSIFSDLSGGAIMIGNVNDTDETSFAKQMVGIHVRDNFISRAGVEYHGAPAIHTFCMRESTIEHNAISDTSYTGISFNWPNPQGPTLGPLENSSTRGYSRNNLVSGNRVSFFMRYMNDGGGIHTIGRSYNTTISGNYLNGMASGRPGEHSAFAESVIYIDNWSCFLNISGNVVDDSPGNKLGYLFFQGVGNNGIAHDNFVNVLYARGSGKVAARGEACNCSRVMEIPAGNPLPSAALEIVKAAGPRSRLVTECNLN